jgi:DNA-binding NtrC family response regulator
VGNAEGIDMFRGVLNMIGRSIDFSAALEKAERDIYVKAYKIHKQNQTATAKALGVARGTFLTKMKKWGII